MPQWDVQLNKGEFSMNISTYFVVVKAIWWPNTSHGKLEQQSSLFERGVGSLYGRKPRNILVLAGEMARGNCKEFVGH